jgi:hypothetical protein
MEKVVMTVETMNPDGTLNNGKVDVEFAMEQKATKPNSVCRFKFTSKPPVTTSPPPPFEFWVGWQDAANISGIIQAIVVANPPK